MTIPTPHRLNLPSGMASTTGRSLRTSASLVRALAIAIALSFGFLMGVATAAAAATSAATPQDSGAPSSAPDNLSIMLMAREGQL